MYLVTKEIYDKLLTCLDVKDKKKVVDLNNQEIGNELGAFPQLPPPPPPLPPPQPPAPPPPPSPDFMNDDSNDYHMPNTPYDYGDDDEWPRLERPNTPSPDIPNDPFYHPNGINLQDYSDGEGYIDDDIPSNFDQAFGPDSVLRTPLKKGLKDSKKKKGKKNIIPTHKFDKPHQPAPGQDRTDSDTPKPSTSGYVMNSQNTPPTSTHSTFKQAGSVKNIACGLCQETFQTYRAFHNHELSEHTSNKSVKTSLSKQLKHKGRNNKSVKLDLGDISKEYDNWGRKQDIKMTPSSGDDVLIPNIAEMGDLDDITVKICQLCKTSFNTTTALNRHLKNVHECNPDYYYTLEQGKKRKLSDVKFKEFLGPPLKKRPSEFLYKCTLCSFTFKDETSRNRHMKNIHDTINHVYMLPQGVKRKHDDYLTCKICSSAFEKKSLYIKHVKSHNNKTRNESMTKPDKVKKETKSREDSLTEKKQVMGKKKKTAYEHW